MAYTLPWSRDSRTNTICKVGLFATFTHVPLGVYKGKVNIVAFTVFFVDHQHSPDILAQNIEFHVGDKICHNVDLYTTYC